MPLTESSSLTEMLLPTAIGASFTDAILMVMVAFTELPIPSFAKKVKVSVP